MRHLVGVALAVVMAAAVFFGGGWGYLRVRGPQTAARAGALPAGGGSLVPDRTFLAGLGALAAVGLLAGIVIGIRQISALAAGLPGLALLGWTGVYLFTVRHAVQYIPLKTRDYGAGFEAMLFDGVLALLGLALVIPLFVPSRWRPARAAVGAAGQAGHYADATTAPYPTSTPSRRQMAA